MPTAAMHTDVLIVGAGPVGLFLANECARRGLRWRLVETRPGQSEHSKALAIFPRTLEIFDMAGVVGPFLEVANRVTSVAIAAHGRTLARMPFAPEETPYPLIAMVSQDVTERLLAEQLQRRGGVIEYDTSFVTAVEIDGGVSAVLQHGGTREDTTATFIVGCDGAHSTVRHLLNLPFEGAAYDASFMLADIDCDTTFPADELLLCPSEFGPLAIFPISATRRRIVATVPEAEADAPSLVGVQALLVQRAPAGIEARAMHWSSYFRIHHRQAGEMRAGRMFIAGDAAHIHSPFGGQGMNTGLHDAWNLAWKLDLVLHGHAHDALLDTYAAERLPVIKKVIDTTHFLTQAMGTPNVIAQAVRDRVIPMVSRLAPFQHAFVQRLAELDVAYHGSPIVEGAGTRHFDDSLRGGNGILRRYLLLFDDSDASIRDLARPLLARFGDVLESRSGPSRDITLVRPDGYVAYCGRAREAKAAFESVAALLERQSRAESASRPRS